MSFLYFYSYLFSFFILIDSFNCWMTITLASLYLTVVKMFDYPIGITALDIISFKCIIAYMLIESHKFNHIISRKEFININAWYVMYNHFQFYSFLIYKKIIYIYMKRSVLFQIYIKPICISITQFNYLPNLLCIWDYKGSTKIYSPRS